MDDRSLKLSMAKRKLQKFQKHKEKQSENIIESQLLSLSNSDVASLPNSVHDKSDNDSTAGNVAQEDSILLETTPSQFINPSSTVDDSEDVQMAATSENLRGLFDRMDEVAHKKINAAQQASTSSTSWFALPSFAAPSIWRTQPSFPQPVEGDTHDCPTAAFDVNTSEDATKAENANAAETIEYLNKEINILRESIGLLTIEKSNFYHSMQKLQQLVDSKDKNLAELNANLEARNKECLELRSQLSTLQKTSHHTEREALRFNHEVSSLKETVEQLRSKNTESASELTEMKKRLKQSHMQLTTLGLENAQLTKDLEMTKIRIIQLTDVESVEKESLHETLASDGSSLKPTSESELVAELRATIDEMETKQREMMTDWRKHCETLQRDLDVKTQEVAQIGSEKDSLWERCALLEDELEQLQHKYSQPSEAVVAEVKDDVKLGSPVGDSSSPKETPANDNPEDVSTCKPTCEMKTEEESCSQCLQWRDLVASLQSRLWESQCAQQQISDQLTMLQETTTARDQLLLTVQGDKTALSRALTQNRQLKHLNEELESKFIAMSKDNMELTTQLQEAQHHEKDLSHRLLEFEKKLKHMHGIQKVSDQLIEVSDSTVQYPDVEVVSQEETVLSSDLQMVADQRVTLSPSQFNEANQQTNSPVAEGANDAGPHAAPSMENVNMTLEQLKLALYQLEAERDRLLKERRSNHILEVELENLRREYKSLQKHYAQLEAENKRLEVEVMQLDGETSTIGEYVSLYRNQRDLLHQHVRKWRQSCMNLIREREAFHESMTQVEQILSQGVDSSEPAPTISDTSVQPNSAVELNQVSSSRVPEESSELDEDDASEVEAIVFSKEAPPEGHVVELRASNTTSIPASDHLNEPPQQSQYRLHQEHWTKLTALVSQLKSTSKPNIELRDLLSNVSDTSSLSSSRSSLVPGTSNASISSAVRGSPSTVFVQAPPSCRCCSGRLMVL